MGLYLVVPPFSSGRVSCDARLFILYSAGELLRRAGFASSIGETGNKKARGEVAAGRGGKKPRMFYGSVTGTVQISSFPLLRRSVQEGESLAGSSAGLC